LIGLTETFKVILLPPAILLIWLAIAAVLVPRWYRLGVSLLIGLMLVFYLLSAPVTALRLIGAIESNVGILSHSDIEALDKQSAIVVLGAGRNRDAAEYSGDTVSDTALARVRYAAKIKRIKDVPLLVSGGKRIRLDQPEAFLMKRALQEDFGVNVEFLEVTSRNTWENAFNTRKLLSDQHIKHVILVTHAWHMPRARFAFEKAGFRVTPAATGFYQHNNKQFGVLAFLPNISGLQASYLACHEILGILWYKILATVNKPKPDTIDENPPAAEIK
jgi:uncharacterized SAM-binding protein YcdF (DUF218 family)